MIHRSCVPETISVNRLCLIDHQADFASVEREHALGLGTRALHRHKTTQAIVPAAQMIPLTLKNHRAGQAANPERDDDSPTVGKLVSPLGGIFHAPTVAITRS